MCLVSTVHSLLVEVCTTLDELVLWVQQSYETYANILKFAQSVRK